MALDGALAIIILGGAVCCQLLVVDASAQVADGQPHLTPADAAFNLHALPPAPRGKSTVLGGEIRSVDAVRDQLSLKIFGQRPVTILFDERTQLYRDGNKISLRELAVTDHASVQTVLDGTAVYALSIHLLSRSPEGEYRGQVQDYNPETHVLTVNSVLFKDPVKLLVPANTPVARVGQASFASGHSGSSDLVAGTLVSVNFESNKQGHGVATQIAVLATPGAAFQFSGNVTSLDMHSGQLTLTDPRDEADYKVSFDSANLAEGKELHVGDHVLVTAVFDGSRYVANVIHAY